MQGLWVAILYISPRVADKIQQLHHITPDEVRQAVVAVYNLGYNWDDDADRGRRAIVTTEIRNQEVAVVLYPAEHPLGDAYNLGSVYFLNEN